MNAVVSLSLGQLEQVYTALVNRGDDKNGLASWADTVSLIRQAMDQLAYRANK